MRLPDAGLWRQPDFLKLWAGQTVSQVGDRLTREGLPLAANLTLGASPEQMGLLAAVGLVPVLLVGLPAGVWVDRFARRPVLIGADLLRAALLGTVPLAAVLGHLRIEQLYVVIALVGVLSVFFNVADQSYLPTLVGRDGVVEGNGKLAMTESLAEISGPTLAGVLVQAITAPLAILCDALSFLVSALAVALIRTPEPRRPARAAGTRAGREVRDGLRLILGHPILRATTGHTATRNFFGGFYATLYGLFLIRELHVSPAEYGVLVTMGGVGALFGAALAGRLVRRYGLGRTLLAMHFGGPTIGLLTPLAGGSHLQILLMLILPQLLGDFASVVFEINETSLRQIVVPDHLLGRANASTHFLTGGLVAVGALLAGVLAETIGMRATLLIAVGGFFAANLWLVFSPIPRLRSFPAAPPDSVTAA